MLKQIGTKNLQNIVVNMYLRIVKVIFYANMSYIYHGNNICVYIYLFICNLKVLSPKNIHAYVSFYTRNPLLVSLHVLLSSFYDLHQHPVIINYIILKRLVTPKFICSGLWEVKRFANFLRCVMVIVFSYCLYSIKKFHKFLSRSTKLRGFFVWYGNFCFKFGLGCLFSHFNSY